MIYDAKINLRPTMVRGTENSKWAESELMTFYQADPQAGLVPEGSHLVATPQ